MFDSVQCTSGLIPVRETARALDFLIPVLLRREGRQCRNVFFDPVLNVVGYYYYDDGK